MLIGIGIVFAISFGIFFIYRKKYKKDFQIIDAEINKSIAEINLKTKEYKLTDDLRSIIRHINREAKKVVENIGLMILKIFVLSTNIQEKIC